MTGNTNMIIAASEFPPLPGGIGNHAFNLARQMNQRGYNVTVLSNARGGKRQELKYLSEKLKGVQVNLIGRSGAIITYCKRIRQLRKSARSLKPNDILLLSGKFWIICASWLKIDPKVRIYAVVHGTEIKTKTSLLIKGLRRANKVICVSSFTQNKLLEKYPELNNSTIVINNGHDLLGKTGLPKARTGEQVRLVTVGNVHPRKGQDAVIRILPELKKVFPDISYHIIGIPTYQKKFASLAHDLGVSELITFHGKVSDHELFELISKMDVFIMLSQELDNGDFEGFGIAILEANAVGLPSIGSVKSGIKDAIQNGMNGYLVNHNNAEEVIASIQNILDDYESFSRQSIAWSTKFQWHVIADQYEQMMRADLS